MSTLTGTQNDLSCYKGAAFTQDFQIVADGTQSGLDISGWTIAFTLKAAPTIAAPLISLAITPTVPTQGRYQVSLTHAQTAALRAAGYVYDVQRTDAGSERVMSIGRFDVLQEVLYP